MPPSYMSHAFIHHLHEREAARLSRAAAASSLANLPSEILQTVFHHALPTVPPEKHTVTVNSLSQVCQKWREVMTGIPLLWSKLQVRVCDTGSWPSPYGVSEYLNRSADYPLTLTLIYERSSSPHSAVMSVNSAVLASVVNAFLAHLHRWRTLALHLDNLRPNMSFPAISLTEQSLHAPLLRSVDMTGSSWFYFSSSQTQWLNTIFKISPKLRTLRSNGEFPLTHFDIPWASLTRLHLLNDISVSTALDILTQAQTLKECYLLRITSPDLSPSPQRDTNTISSHTVTSTPRIIPSHLHTLALVSKVPIDKIFMTITLPSLTHLSINIAPKILLKYSAFMTFLVRSACRIQTFCLQPSCTDSDELLLYLTHFSSSLKTLHLRTSDTLFYPFPVVSADIIEQLTHRREIAISTLCPLLETIYFERCLSRDIPEGAISYMIQSRWKADSLLPTSPIVTAGSTVSRLRSVDIIFPTGHNLTATLRKYGKDLKVFQRLAFEGLAGRAGLIPSGYGTGMLPYEGLLFATYPPYKMYSQAC